MQKTIEGEIRITIDAEKNVSIVNTRPLEIVSHLTGLTPKDALRRISLLFSVCRNAQTLAGCYAVEDASSFELAPEQRQARTILLAAETLREHAMNLLLHWPVLLGQQPACVDTVRQLRASLGDLSNLLYPQNDWMLAGGGRLNPDTRTLRQRLIAASNALSVANLSSLLETRDFHHWRATASGPAANLFRLLEEEGWNEYGDTQIAALEKPNRQWLDALLAVDDDLQFVAQPNWHGLPQFTGPLARQYDEPLIKHSRARYRCGLATHLLAHCVEIERTRKMLFTLCSHLKSSDHADFVLRDGSGIAIVQAARGILVHRVEIAEHHIERYQILAPTEWNFHPRGVIATALQQGCTDNMQPAHLLVAALDPCVAWKISQRP